MKQKPKPMKPVEWWATVVDGVLVSGPYKQKSDARDMALMLDGRIARVLITEVPR